MNFEIGQEPDETLFKQETIGRPWVSTDERETEQFEAWQGRRDEIRGPREEDEEKDRMDQKKWGWLFSPILPVRVLEHKVTWYHFLRPFFHHISYLFYLQHIPEVRILFLVSLSVQTFRLLALLRMLTSKSVKSRIMSWIESSLCAACCLASRSLFLRIRRHLKNTARANCMQAHEIMILHPVG